MPTHANVMAHLIVFCGMDGTPTAPLIIGMQTWYLVRLIRGVLDFVELGL